LNPKKHLMQITWKYGTRKIRDTRFTFQYAVRKPTKMQLKYISIIPSPLFRQDNTIDII